MRRLILARLAAMGRAVQRALVAAHYGLIDRELQLLDTHAERMRAERAALCEQRGRLALEMLRMEDRHAHF